MFITVVKPETTFPFQYIDPDTKAKSDSVFTLRIVPDDFTKAVHTDTTKKGWDRGRRVEETEWDEYTRECLDYAILDWSGIKVVDAKGVRGDLPCTRENKFLLPERVKSEIIRLCVGKEAGQALEEEARPKTPKERAQAERDSDQ